VDDSDFTWRRFDLDPSLLHRDSQSHPGKDPSLVSDRLGKDQTAGGIDGGSGGTFHGRNTTMACIVHAITQLQRDE
jgi:hypothetical protein